MGKAYIKCESPHDPVSRREADIKNLKLYFEKYALVEGELKREANPFDTDYERIADVFELERKYRNWIPLHHASQSDIKYFWVAATALRELLHLQAIEKGTNPYLRATDIYFRGLSTMADSLKEFGVKDYDNGNAARRFCGNMAITPGIKTTHTSSSSFEYFINAHSVQAPAALKRFEEAMQLLGMTQASYLPYQSLYEKYFGCVFGEKANSAWTTVFVNPDDLDTYTYPAHGGGTEFHEGFAKGEKKEDKIPSSLGLYKSAKIELLKKTNPRVSENTNSTSTSGKLVDSIAEIRLLLKPSIMTDPSKVKVFSKDRFPLTPSQEQNFKKELTALAIHDLGNWLSEHTKVMKDSLHQAPALKKLYAQVYKGITGKKVEETVSKEAFPHLIKNGHHEGAQQFFESYGDIIKELQVEDLIFALWAVRSGSAETVKFVTNTLLKKSIEEIFSPENIKGLLLECLDRGKFTDAHAFVFENYPWENIEKETREFWAISLLPNAPQNIITTFHNNVLPITEVLINQAIKTALKLPDHSPKQWEGLVESGIIEKEKLASLLLQHVDPNSTSQGQKGITEALLKLVDKGLDCTQLCPLTEGPLLFSMAYLPFEKNHTECLKALFQKEKSLETTNKEGLTLLQFIQKKFLEGHKADYYFIKALNEITTENLNDFYPPFLEEFGAFKDIYNSPPPFKDLDFKEWHHSLEEAYRNNSLSQVVAVWKKIPNPNYLTTFYFLKNPLNYLWKGGSVNDYSDCPPELKEKWNETLKNDQYKELFPLIDHIHKKKYPTQNYLYHALQCFNSDTNYRA